MPPSTTVEDFRDKDGQWNFGSSFIRWDADRIAVGDIPKTIYVIWAGNNPMLDARRRCLESIRAVQQGLSVVLVTPQNLADYVVEHHPMHSAYVHLSDVHKSDYLRAYLMHHHGGAYTDVKEHRSPWLPLLERYSSRADVWLVGYPEPDSGSVAHIEDQVGAHLRRHYSRSAGHTGFFARSGTPYTREWLDEIERRLDYFATLLERSPAQDPFGHNKDYPIPWTALGSQVAQPLQIKHQAHIVVTASLMPVPSGHRDE